MTKEERLQFAAMCSRESKMANAYDDASRLTLALLYASQKRNLRLYRYRSVNEYSLEELLFGYIYAGSALRFNDPLDSMPLVDRDRLVPMYREMYPDTNMSDTVLAESLNKVADENKQWFRTAAHVASLCEEYDNELMWSHYAESHKGFVLGYDIPKDSSDRISQVLYPVIYSNKPLSICEDAVIDVLQHFHARHTDTPQKLITNNFWCFFTVLFKRECWHYEKEWRLMKVYSLNGGEIPEHLRIFQKANVIYYGVDIDINDEIRLHTYAMLNNVTEYKMKYVYQDGEYVLKAIPYVSMYDEQCQKFLKDHYDVIFESRFSRIQEHLERLKNEKK